METQDRRAGHVLEDRNAPPSPFMYTYATICAWREIDAGTPFPEASLVGRLWKELGL